MASTFLLFALGEERFWCILVLLIFVWFIGIDVVLLPMVFFSVVTGTHFWEKLFYAASYHIILFF